MRVLYIGDDTRFGALLENHLGCRWPDAELIKRAGDPRSPPDPEYLAQGFDAVVVDQVCANGHGHEWAYELAGRPDFAPVIYLANEIDGPETREACASGATAVLARPRMDHVAFLAAVE